MRVFIHRSQKRWKAFWPVQLQGKRSSRRVSLVDAEQRKRNARRHGRQKAAGNDTRRLAKTQGRVGMSHLLQISCERAVSRLNGGLRLRFGEILWPKPQKMLPPSGKK